MAFSLQNTYFPLSNPLGLPDTVDPQKALELRQNLVTHLLSRLQSVQEFEPSINNLSSPSPDQLPSRKPPGGQNTLLNSPGWFQHALASSLQMGLLPIPRNLLRDLCLPPLPNPSLSMGVPRMNNISPPFEPSPQEIKPKPPSKPCRPPVEQVRSSSVAEYKTPSTSRQQTFRPVARKYSERPIPSWKSAANIRNTFENADPQETGTLVPSLIDGEIIMGFNVWGEKRLCLPHLFRFVLHDVDLKVIDEACTKLQITCTTCSPAQLNLLHAHKILPRAVGSCGLIRKSDAERLTKYIRHKCDNNEAPHLNDPISIDSPIADSETIHKCGSKQSLKFSDPSDDNMQSIPFSSGNIKSQNSADSKSTISQDEDQSDDLARELTESSAIPVIHECFGRQMGLIYPKLYSEAQSKCIKCCTCARFFTPEQFVGHTHTVTEVDKLNHWGFDSTNWRCYLRLYTGRRLRSNSKLASDPPGSETSIGSSTGSYRDHNKENSIILDGHRRLEEFKIKFAQPIKLPTALSAALRSVGLCASVAPIPPPADGLQQASNSSEISSPTPNPSTNRKILSTKLQHHFSQPHPLQPHLNKQQEAISSAFGITANSQSTTGSSSPLYSGVMPQLTLRRLWAPNDGRIKLPPPPKLLTNCEMKSIPNRLHTGPPLLLHSHRVISRDAADQYDRDFIPNVCLKPCSPHESNKSGYLVGTRRRRYHHRVHRSNKHDSSVSSASRSCSQCSSGSSSSRTRSSSGSSTSSSRCSYDKSTRKDHRDNISNPGRNMSCRNLVNFDRSNQIPPDKSSPKSELSSSIYQRVRSRSCTLDFELRKSCLLPELGSCCQRSASYPPKHNVEFRDNSPLVRRCFLTNGSKRKASTSSYRKTKCSSHHNRELKQRSKAMAAAIAAQGAASRVCPGLWARHFTKFRGSTSESMLLPSARRLNDLSESQSSRPKSMITTPVLVTNSMNNSLPTAVLALEAIWADLVRLINEYTVCVESRSGVGQAYQRLFEQLIAMQTCYATHIATLMNENQKLNEKIEEIRNQMNTQQHTTSTSSVSHHHPSPHHHQQQQSPNINPKRDRQGYLNFPIGPSGVSVFSPGVAPNRSHTNVYDKQMDKSNDSEEIQSTNKRAHSSDFTYRHPTKMLSTSHSSPFQRNLNSVSSSTSEDKSQLQLRPNSTQELTSVNLNRSNESPSEFASQSSSTPTASETDGMNKEPHESGDDQTNENSITQIGSSINLVHSSQSPNKVIKHHCDTNSASTWYSTSNTTSTTNNNDNNSNVDRKRKHCGGYADQDEDDLGHNKIISNEIVRRPNSSACGPPIFPHYSQKRRATMSQYIPVTDTRTK